MFDRPHHQRIAKVLNALNSDLLQEAECYFGGGTAIVLSLGEYRESVDIDFLCASREGYRLLRNIVTEHDLGELLVEPFKYARDVKTDRNAIRTFIEVDGVPIKIEFVREDRIILEGEYDPVLGVPKLSRSDMYAEKILANADRGLDKFVKSRDIIDLAMMISSWGAIPREALEKVYDAYGEHAFVALHKSVGLIQDKEYFLSCLRVAHIDEDMADRILDLLEDQLQNLELRNGSSMAP